MSKELGESSPVARRLLSSIWLLLLLAACGEDEATLARREATGIDAPAASPTAVETGADRFVGSEVCIGCHADEGARWQGSHHDRAMEEATPESVAGRFDGSILRHSGQLWRFLTSGDEFVVELEESGKATRRLTVAYTFGFDPLQQYLVTRPDGRMQALPVAWDARSPELGGQRWIDLQPEGPIPPEDPLHWDRLAYNWNSQCASCHSTELIKGYDETSKQFETHWAEIDVGCEACHGPGSDHIAVVARTSRAPGELDSATVLEASLDFEAEAGKSTGLKVSFERWKESDWRRAAGDRIASRVVVRSHDEQLDVCAPCHSRRTQIAEAPEIGDEFLDGYRPRLLAPGLYFEDGQIRDEVYVWGSFLQSRMYAAGVRCADCHDPHSLGLRRSGSDLCTGCHDREAYALKRHHGHEPGSVGAECVDCHMPERTYMEIDGRRDHSFPIPRPGRSAALQAPDVCQNCHGDRAEQDAAWAERQIASWRASGTIARPHWADQLVADSVARDDSVRWFEIAMEPAWPAIVRANAWSRLAQESAGSPPLELLRARLRDGSDLERFALIEMARLLPPEARADLLRPLLDDALRTIRIEAATALVDLPASIWRPSDRSLLARGLAEYRAAQEVNAERPEAQVSLGVLAAQYGELESARASYLRALDQAPYFVPAYANLADLERALGRDEAAVGWLRQALELAPGEALTRYALGLALHRLGKTDEALSQLALAAKAAPDQPQLVLGWALSLDAAGRRAEAIMALSESIEGGLTAADLYHALVSLQRDEGKREQARRRAAEWATVWPNDPRAAALLRELSGPR
jgi:predicted CXXCH cytochrome family protein